MNGQSLHAPANRTAAPRRTRLPSLVALALLLATGACADALPTGPTEPPAEVPAAAREYVALVNQHRARAGCGPLAWHDRAAAVAQRHSEDMVRRSFFAHVNPDGQSPGERLSAGQVAFHRAGENLARGQATAEEALGAWLASPSHRRNIETCAFTHHGLGLHENHWTHVFIRR